MHLLRPMPEKWPRSASRSPSEAALIVVRLLAAPISHFPRETQSPAIEHAL